MKQGLLDRKPAKRSGSRQNVTAAAAGAHRAVHGDQQQPKPAGSDACATAAAEPPQRVKLINTVDKGTYLVATELITAGSLVLSEAPLLSLDNFVRDGEEKTFETERRKHMAVDAGLQRLSAADQRAFWSLHNSFTPWSPASLGTF